MYARELPQRLSLPVAIAAVKRLVLPHVNLLVLRVQRGVLLLVLPVPEDVRGLVRVLVMVHVRDVRVLVKGFVKLHAAITAAVNAA